ncbi:Histone-lysine N-methyltransferase SUVR2 [Platanthera zijinensis]|uniref:Histone-lysine N-methyltransferase SUVR2 n=1 Tax=Platanthera zijinensis TaxID=2320716 RepID=A0AAP0BQM4_9ASPA
MPSALLLRAMAAVKAMKLIGFDQRTAKNALKKLLKVYESNWEYIEAENYKLLIDSILDDVNEESMDPDPNEKDEDEISRKRLKCTQDDSGPSVPTIEPEAVGETSLKRKKLVESAQCSYEGGDGVRLKKGSLASHSKCNMEPITEHNEVQEEIAVVGSSIIPDKLMAETWNDTSGKYNDPIGAAAHNGIASTNSVSAEKEAISELASAQKLISTNASIASSNTGKVKLSLTYFGGRNLKVPSIESVLKIVEDRCLKSYKILHPNFSLMNLMKEICQSAADLAAESNDSQEALKRSGSSDIPRRVTRSSFVGSSNLVSSSEITRETMNGLHSSPHVYDDNNDIPPEICAPDSLGNNVSQCLPNLSLNENVVIASSPRHDQNDIAKGEERIRISLINEFTNEKAPPYFHYIPWNAIYQNAHVNFSLAQIGEEDCCLNCFCNCLSAPIPCACTQKTGGEFVYTIDGLLKKEFLDECISMNRYPEKHRYYCKSCPIEKSKTHDPLDPCKGHLVRKFIKECWSKCGCNKQCGNRVVQRGITRNLQVFYTDDGRGWGLKTLEELPKGAFICEYVGEILTTKELFDRTLHKTHGANQTYPMLLDANWGTKEDLRDEEALCLDATVYGNIGRFVNHRCSDANLVEIPVEWETSDHHYYHLAFFTTRKIEALEELTRDYGIDFKSRTHPIKAFKCRCGSRYCRVRSKARLRLLGSK